MNIVKLQDDLKNVPDNALVGYVQNPSGQVPSYLALSELQRRKKMREQASGAQAQGQSNMPSVAEQLVAESAPQAGIAGIPVTNVGDEDAYATGGIVSFAQGKEVSLYDENNIDPSLLYALEQERAAKERGMWGAGLKDAILGVTGTPSSWRYALTGGALGSPYEPSSAEAKKAYKKQLETQADRINREKYANTLLNFGPMAGYSPAEAAEVDTTLINPQTAVPTPEAIPAVDMKVPVDISKAPADTGSATTRTSAVGGMGAQRPAGIAGLTAPVIQDRSGEYVYTQVPEAMAEKQRYLELMGEDPYTAKAKERISAMEAENAKYKEQYPWMALAEAGFGMAAGKSPYALQNIAEGGQRGVTALYKGRKDVQEQEEKIFNAEAKVAESERALQTAAAKYGLDSEQTAKAANKLEKDKMFAYKTDIEAKNIQNKIEIDKFNKQQELENNRLTRQINADNNRFALQLKSAEKQTNSAYDREKIAAMSKSMENATAVYNTASKRYSDALKSMDPNELQEAKIELAQAKKEYDIAQLYAKKVLGMTGGEYLGIENKEFIWR